MKKIYQIALLFSFDIVVILISTIFLFNTQKEVVYQEFIENADRELEFLFEKINTKVDHIEYFVSILQASDNKLNKQSIKLLRSAMALDGSILKLSLLNAEGHEELLLFRTLDSIQVKHDRFLVSNSDESFEKNLKYDSSGIHMTSYRKELALDSLNQDSAILRISKSVSSESKMLFDRIVIDMNLSNILTKSNLNTSNYELFLKLSDSDILKFNSDEYLWINNSEERDLINYFEKLGMFNFQKSHFLNDQWYFSKINLKYPQTPKFFAFKSKRSIDTIISSRLKYVYIVFLIITIVLIIALIYRLQTTLNNKFLISKLSLTKNNLEKVLYQKEQSLVKISKILKDPFAGILLKSRKINELAIEDSLEKVEKLSLDIYNSANETMNLLENLMIWNVFDYQFNPSDVIKIKSYDLINSCFLNAELIATLKKIHLQNYVPDSHTFTNNYTIVEIVVNNIISNAIKFTHKNGLVEVLMVDETQNIILVRDNGIGISNKKLSNIFDFKYNSKSLNLGTINEDGIGVGLVLCKNLMEQINGDIWIESELGKGTSVFLKFPDMSS